MFSYNITLSIELIIHSWTRIFKDQVGVLLKFSHALFAWIPLQVESSLNFNTDTSFSLPPSLADIGGIIRGSFDHILIPLVMLVSTFSAVHAEFMVV